MSASSRKCQHETTQRRMVGLYASDELERIREETVIDYSKNNPEIFLKLLRKTTKIRSQDSWCPGRDSNVAPPEHECVDQVVMCEAN
jgi:hypothetical protein